MAGGRVLISKKRLWVAHSCGFCKSGDSQTRKQKLEVEIGNWKRDKGKGTRDGRSQEKRDKQIPHAPKDAGIRDDKRRGKRKLEKGN